MGDSTVIEVEEKRDPNEAWLDEEIETPVGAEPEASQDLVKAVTDPGVEAVTMPPGVAITPEVSELTRMAQLAVTFAHAQLVPDALRDRPADVLLVMMQARSLGFDFVTGFRELFVIDGKVSMSTKSKLALARQRGMRVWPDPGNDGQSATWHGVRDGITYSSTFDMDDAAAVEVREHGKNITLDQKSTYRQYPKNMLSWRACGYLLDQMCSEIATGIYSPDELGAVTDEHGEVIEISEVEPLVESEKDAKKRERATAGEARASEDEINEIADRIARLPEELRAELRDVWVQAEIPSLKGLPSGHLRRVKAMVRGFETKAQRAPAQKPEAESEGVGDAETPAEPGERHSGADPGEILPNGYPSDENEQRKRVAAELSDALDGVPEDVRNAATEFARKAGWQRIDKALRQRGEDIEGLHVDSRRMLMVAYLVAEWPETGVPGLDEDIVQEES